MSIRTANSNTSSRDIQVSEAVSNLQQSLRVLSRCKYPEYLHKVRLQNNILQLLPMRRNSLILSPLSFRSFQGIFPIMTYPYIHCSIDISPPFYTAPLRENTFTSNIILYNVFRGLWRTSGIMLFDSQAVKRTNRNLLKFDYTVKPEGEAWCFIRVSQPVLAN